METETQNKTNNDFKLSKIQGIIYPVLFILLVTAAGIIFGNDFPYMMLWYLTMLVLGAAAYPSVSRLFKNFSDRGWIFSKILGWLLAGYLMWFFSSIHIMKFSFSACIITTVLMAVLLGVLPAVISLKKNKAAKGEVEDGAEEGDGSFFEALFPYGIPSGSVLFMEFIFLFSFFFFCYYRCFRPEAFGQEKMMDYGFMNRMFFTDYFPPDDMWFAGEKLNYYYFGQYIFTYLTKLSGNTVSLGYNFGMGTAFAVYFTLPFVLAFELMASSVKKAENVKHKLFHCYSAGFAAAAVSVFSANMQYVIYSKIVPMVREMLQLTRDYQEYWFADSSRYIGSIPDVEDKTAVEFGAYSMVTGDLHAHVVNQLYVMTFLGLLLSFMIDKRNSKYADEEDRIDWLHELLDPRLIVCAVLMGIFYMCSSWDVAIYYVVAGSILLALNIRNHKKILNVVILTAVQGVMFILGGLIVSLPFVVSFVPMASGVAFTSKHSRFYQLVVMWGLPFGMFIAFFVMLLKNRAGKSLREFLRNLLPDELYLMLTCMCSAGLVLIPEIIYLKDIYAGSYERFNTMFKLTYQTNSMMAVFMGYVLIRFILRPEMRGQRKWGIIAFLLTLVSCTYFFAYANRWYGNVLDKNEKEELEADYFVKREADEDYYAIEWIKENVEPGTVVLEAHGDAYTLDDRVSVFAATRTVAGWRTHEWLWHNDVDPIDGRNEDVDDIYTATYGDETMVRELLDKYGVEYIFAGSREYARYSDEIDTDFLCSLGEVVYEGISDSGYESVYVIKVR
ncbi:MAG: hypothetical protein IKO53_01530 [Lachnospiraceae bacterium]|nr:hypothetical protein [Lachnospiraceae bacterium]